jgi:serine phosphatase RsbU (regulator of sigma subunit)
VATEHDQRQRDESAADLALDAFAETSRALAEGASLGEALERLVGAAALAAHADVAIARVLDPRDEALKARAVHASSAAVAAELEGSRFPGADLPRGETDEAGALPSVVRRAAERAGAQAVLQVPIWLDDRPIASLELHRSRGRFTPGERVVVRLVAYQVGLAVRALGAVADGQNGASAEGVLEVAGEALAAGLDEARVAGEVTRLAARATDAVAALLWRVEGSEPPALLSAFGVSEADEGVAEALAAAERALVERQPFVVEGDGDGLPVGATVSASLALGQPPLGALQLLFAADRAPSEGQLAKLATFAVRAAHALRSSAQASALAGELERTRDLLAVVGQAIAELSLAHTADTAAERVSALIGIDRLAVYVVEEGRLAVATERQLAGPHLRVAETLLELALGPLRGRGIVVVEDAATDPRMRQAEDAIAEAGIEAAIALPLVVHDQTIGLLALYPPRPRAPTPNESAFLSALAVQLGVAVQNAQLHEEATELGARLERALASERQSARQLNALYEISRSFAQTLSLETTLQAVARTVVELLGVDAAVIRMPDERPDQLVLRAVHVADARLDAAFRAIVEQPQSFAKLVGRRLFRMGRPLWIDPDLARKLGSTYELFVPFLERGSTAAVVPIATPGEVLGTLMLVSLDPGRPLTEDTVEAALAVAGQAALAIDNARLYQQQKDFADTMQRSLLPRSAPELPGLELGAVYESSARVDVGGDVYDYLRLDDSRVAVVLGDVTGHGIEATADMAMAKFVFRSLAREHPEPAAFLASANEVVVGEIGPAKFITMLYLTVDAERGEVACACAGHPPPRIVDADGQVRELAVGGLALGIEPGQVYEEIRERLPPGASVVLFTDGVVEARRDGELYGLERLDDVLARSSRLSPKELAAEVLADCRSFAGSDLSDDCAVVVIRRTPGA